MSMWGRREKEVPAAIERKGCGPGQAREDVDGRERYSRGCHLQAVWSVGNRPWLQT